MEKQNLIRCMNGKLSVLLMIGIMVLALLASKPAFAPQLFKQWSSQAMWEQFEQEIVRVQMKDRLDSLQHQLIHQYQFNGSLLIAHKGIPLLSFSHGEANLRQQLPATPNSPFQLASVSKMFTAAAVLLLAEDGLLSIDDSVQQHLPEWPYHDQTIRHLLTHRSGLARYMAVASWYWQDPKQAMRNEHVLDQYAQYIPLTFFTPDHGFNYCNSNYVVLAELVARVSGQAFDEFLKDRIFDPLEMKDAFLYRKGDPTRIPEVIGYKPGRRGYYAAYHDYIDGVWGDKNLYASIQDLQLFDRALWEGRLLNEESMRMMWTPGSPSRTNNYGLGWRLRVKEDQTLPYHFGWWRGFRTCYIHDTESGLSLIMLSNLDDSRRIPGYWDLFHELKRIWPKAPAS